MREPSGKLLGVSLLALAGTLGCSSQECALAGPVTLGSFNAGLARGDVGYVDERIEPVIAALSTENVDVLCVQEFWATEDWNALTAGASTLPNTVRLPPKADCPTGCMPGQLDALLVCGEANCAGLAGAELLGCGANLCSDELDTLATQNMACLNCVVETGQAGGSMDDMLAACSAGGEGTGDPYMYDCSYDTGLLTRAPIVAQEARPLDSYLMAASVEFARISTASGEIDVLCIHLASDMSFTYQGDFESWEGEQAHQIEQVLAFIAEKTDGSRPVLLMGDLNTGPAIPAAGVEPVWPDHYQRLRNAGFADPYASQQNANCTICPDNTLRADDSAPQMLDHLLVRGAFFGTSSARVMTETVSLQTADGAVESSYSDHYGLVLTIDGWCAQ